MKILTRTFDFDAITEIGSQVHDMTCDILHVLVPTFFENAKEWVVTRFIPHGGDVGDEYVVSEVVKGDKSSWNVVIEKWLKQGLCAFPYQKNNGRIEGVLRIQNQETPYIGAKLTLNCGPGFTHGIILSRIGSRPLPFHPDTRKVIK